jgi:hypothetical protein
VQEILGKNKLLGVSTYVNFSKKSSGKKLLTVVVKKEEMISSFCLDLYGIIKSSKF